MNDKKKQNKIVDRRKIRVRAKLSGTAQKPRISVFKSNKHVYLQAIDDAAQKTIAFAKTGSELAKKLKEKNIATALFDRGSYKYHGIVEQLAQDIRKNGIRI